MSKSSISNFGCLKTYLLLLFDIIFLSYWVFSCPMTLPLVRDRSILQSYPTDHTINLTNKSTQVYQSVRGLVFVLLSLLHLSLRQQKGEQKPISGICGGFSWRWRFSPPLRVKMKMMAVWWPMFWKRRVLLLSMSGCPPNAQAGCAWRCLREDNQPDRPPLRWRLRWRFTAAFNSGGFEPFRLPVPPDEMEFRHCAAHLLIASVINLSRHTLDKIQIVLPWLVD